MSVRLWIERVDEWVICGEEELGAPFGWDKPATI